MSTSSDTTSGTHAPSESAIMIRDGIATIARLWMLTPRHGVFRGLRTFLKICRQKQLVPISGFVLYPSYCVSLSTDTPTAQVSSIGCVLSFFLLSSE